MDNLGSIYLQIYNKVAALNRRDSVFIFTSSFDLVGLRPLTDV